MRRIHLLLLSAISLGLAPIHAASPTAERYLTQLKLRPLPGTLFDRFIEASLADSTLEALTAKAHALGVITWRAQTPEA